MRLCTAVVLVFAVAATCDLTNFNNFKRYYNKNYSPEEHGFRHAIFERNVNYIKSFNKQKSNERGYRLGVTKFADMLFEEFTKSYNGLRINVSAIAQQSLNETEKIMLSELPVSVDWRQKGAVTPVKDQGKCGSCWAFSTTGSIEGQLFRKTGNLLPLSEQQMIDCSWLNLGCGGGQPILAFEYVRLNGGLETESGYPYTAVDGSCEADQRIAAAQITGFRIAGFYSESALQKALAHVGPISVAMDASGTDFQHYKSGVYNPESCSTIQLDHAVLAVGYGTGDQGDYWLVKNSWSTGWGDEGYFKLARNKGNTCGIATLPVYPTV